MNLDKFEIFELENLKPVFGGNNSNSNTGGDLQDGLGPIQESNSRQHDAPMNAVRKID